MSQELFWKEDLEGHDADLFTPLTLNSFHPKMVHSIPIHLSYTKSL